LTEINEVLARIGQLKLLGLLVHRAAPPKPHFVVRRKHIDPSNLLLDKLHAAEGHARHADRKVEANLALHTQRLNDNGFL
jgi:hypothetical protein